MAATVQNKKLGQGDFERGDYILASIEVTFTGVTSYAWSTGLREVLFAGGNKVSGTGIGADGVAISGGTVTVTATASDVITLYAVGLL